MRRLVPLVLVSFVLPLPAAAQRLAPSPFVSADVVPTPPPDPSAVTVRPTSDPVWLAFGGVLGGAGGLLGGALVGARLTQDQCEDCFLVGLAYGAVAGGSVGLPLGVHLTNGGRGRLLPSLAASLALGGIGLGVSSLTHTYEIMLAVPVLQLVSAITIERKTSPQP